MSTGGELRAAHEWERKGPKNSPFLEGSELLLNGIIGGSLDKDQVVAAAVRIRGYLDEVRKDLREIERRSIRNQTNI